MRTHKIGNTTIEYPDEISFCFNPVVINIYGHAWDYVEVTVTDIVSEISYLSSLESILSIKWNIGLSP